MKFVFTFIGSILTNWVNSFNNDKGGFSARKEAAFGGFVVAVYATYKFTSPDNVVEVVVMWLLYSLLCLSVITFQQITEFKQGKKESPQ